LAVVVAVAAVFGANAHYPYQSKILEEQVMSGLLRNQKTLVARLVMFVVLLVLTTSLGACNKQGGTASEKAVQKSFASPDDAGAALLDAAKSGGPGYLACDLRS